MQQKLNSFLIQYLYYYEKLSVKEIAGIINLDEDEVVNVIDWAEHVVNVLFDVKDNEGTCRVMEMYMNELQESFIPIQSKSELLKSIINNKSDSK